jgi:hypothetical protein
VLPVGVLTVENAHETTRAKWPIRLASHAISGHTDAPLRLAAKARALNSELRTLNSPYDE